MSIEIVALGAFLVVFLLGTLRSVNMGALALVGAFLVGTLVYGTSTDVVVEGFPGEMFVILVGVTYLFAIANHNGTVDWLVQTAVVLVGGRVALVPWTMFVVPAVLTSVGAAAPAACAIIIPIALKFANRHRINPVMMSMMVIQGTTAGGFSPIGIYGVIVNEISEKAGLPTSPILLYAGTFATTVLLAGAAYVTMGGRQLLGHRATAVSVPARAHASASPVAAASLTTASAQILRDDRPDVGPQPQSTQDSTDPAPPTNTKSGLSREGMLNLIGIATLVVLTLAFGLNVGFVALTIAAVLSLIYPGSAKAAVSGVAWPTVLLICGIITYVSLLQGQGTIDWLGSGIADIGTPLLAAFLILLIGAAVSAFASTTALLGVVIPLAVPFLLTDQVAAVPLIIALAVSSSVVDCSPLSTMGALAVANADEGEREQVFAGLMRWGMSLIVAAPVVTFAVLVLPSAV